jgi:DNA-binding NarL/FixJ family response regulator
MNLAISSIGITAMTGPLGEGRFSLCLLDGRPIFCGAVAQLSRSDLQATLGFLREAASVTGPDGFPTELLNRLRDVVLCDFVAYEERDCAGVGMVVYETCARGREIDASQPAELTETFWQLDDLGPLCAYLARTGDLTARKLSDFVTRRQWHRLEVYTDYFRFFGVEDRLTVGIPAQPGHTKQLFFDRCGERNFGERARLLLNSLQPHLAALDAAARQRRLATALLHDQNGAGLVVMESANQIDFATPAAARLLAHYFEATPDGCLPKLVRSWLRREDMRLNGNKHPLPATPPLSVDRGGRRLTIRKAGHSLLLEEEIVTLTSREREIVAALADGCSNVEIAERLTIATTTVRRHLENIYAKLDVHTRTAAAARVRALPDNSTRRRGST